MKVQEYLISISFFLQIRRESTGICVAEETVQMLSVPIFFMQIFMLRYCRISDHKLDIDLTWESYICALQCQVS